MSIIQEAVKSKYGAVATSGLSSDHVGVRAVAEAFGYTPEELGSIPAEANMGLSCGNPTATASLKLGETVVDLGCGGGLDVLLAAKKVGPAGNAIGIDMTADLIREKVAIVSLATVGVIVSTVLVGGMIWGLLALVGIHASPIYYFLFGALISPTDPIAVLSLLKRFGAPKNLEVTIAAESLFNDGVGLVVFAALLGVALGGRGFDPGSLAVLFARETVGGAAFGLLAGSVAYRLLKSVDDYQVEILLSLALVAGGTALAYALHLSAPIAMAFAGLPIGN